MSGHRRNLPEPISNHSKPNDEKRQRDLLSGRKGQFAFSAPTVGIIVFVHPSDRSVGSTLRQRIDAGVYMIDPC